MRHAVTILASRVAASPARRSPRAARFERRPIPSVHDHHVVHAAGRARARTRAASRSCPRSPCRRPPAARRASASSTRHRRAVRVEHAGRRAGDDQPARAEARRQMSGERVGVDVEQPAVASEADARDDRHEAAGDQASCSSRDVGVAAGTPTRPRSTDAPVDACWCGGARVRQAARRRRRRSARPPARRRCSAPRRTAC